MGGIGRCCESSGNFYANAGWPSERRQHDAARFNGRTSVPADGLCGVTELELLRRSRGSSTGDEGHNAQPPSAEVSLLAQLEMMLCIPLENPLLSKPRLRRSRTPSMVMSVCQSGRLVAKTKASNPTIQAQNVLKQKLGIIDMPQGLGPMALDSIKAFFAALCHPPNKRPFERSSL
ncbi:unnamed protein product [Miscanthus lutarioriparius]|uniref:Uncharacterized protein n=1 Tax=Miscanthus lutarioriparius TaxID=422564 RepID=A0A811P1S6_9POAL|nr:unnamed protein product [Miscanthus lutarioriparius]